MTKSLSTNTLVALSSSAANGLSIRDFVSITAKDRDTGALEALNLWNGWIPVTANVINPADGSTDTRVYQAGGGVINVPSMPSTLSTEVRSVTLTLSHLSEAAINAIRFYDAQMAPIQIHRGIFDTTTGALVDPAICRFSGYINKAPILTPKTGQEGSIKIECVSQSRLMTRSSGKLFSVETLKARVSGSSTVDMFGKYLDVAGAWRIWWGQEQTTIEWKGRPTERFIK